MTYQNITFARFISRPNRFVADVELENRIERVHVKNTGRCRELLIPGCTVVLARSDSPQRKTKYDLIAVRKEKEPLSGTWINMDAQAPNEVVEEWLREGGLFSPFAKIQREVFCGTSRFDFYVEDGGRKAFLEVKGVTLVEGERALFPDAPTIRGMRHVNELAELVDRGMEAYVIFVIQLKGVREFRPNEPMHADFGVALRNAAQKGVCVRALDCLVTPDSMCWSQEIPVCLGGEGNEG